MIFNGFNNNIKKFNITLNNNNITNINRADKEHQGNNSLLNNEKQHNTVEDHKQNQHNTITSAEDSSNLNNLTTSNPNLKQQSNTKTTNKPALNIQNFLSIHNNFINSGNTNMKNYSLNSNNRTKNNSNTKLNNNGNGKKPILIENTITNPLNSLTSQNLPRQNSSIIPLTCSNTNVRNNMIKNNFTGLINNNSLKESINLMNNLSLNPTKKVGSCNSVSKDNVTIPNSNKINFKIPMHKLKTELLITPRAIPTAPKSDRKSYNNASNGYNDIKYNKTLSSNQLNLNLNLNSINNPICNNPNNISISNIGNSIRLDKLSEKSNTSRQDLTKKSTSRNNTKANLSHKNREKQKKNITTLTTDNILGSFRVKKMNSNGTGKDSNIGNSNLNDTNGKKSTKKRDLKEVRENFQQWKRIKKMNSMKDNNELSMTNEGSKDISTEKTLNNNKEGDKKSKLNLKNISGLKLRDSYLCGINPKNLKQ